MGSKHRSHRKFGAGIILLAVQNAVKDSSFVHLSVLPSLNVILSRQGDVWGRQECCHSFPGLAPADFLQGLRGHFWVYMHCWTNLWWGNEIMHNNKAWSWAQGVECILFSWGVWTAWGVAIIWTKLRFFWEGRRRGSIVYFIYCSYAWKQKLMGLLKF